MFGLCLFNPQSTENTEPPMELLRLFCAMKQLLEPIPSGYLNSGPIFATVKLKELNVMAELYMPKLLVLKSMKVRINPEYYRQFTGIIEYFGIRYPYKEGSFAAYLFGIVQLSIIGLFYEHAKCDPENMKKIYEYMVNLTQRYFLYDELFPDLFIKVEETLNSLTPCHEVMLVNMNLCQFVSAITRIIVNFKEQVECEKQVHHLEKSMEHLLARLVEYLKLIPLDKMCALKGTIYEILYRIEINSDIFTNIEDYVCEIVKIISPIDRIKMHGRTALRVAIIAAEMDFRELLLALRVYQFDMVLCIAFKIMTRLKQNLYFCSTHEGAGSLCFTGFSMKFTQFANEALEIIEVIPLHDFENALCAAESVLKLILHFYNVPNRRYWDGYWYATYVRTIDVINKLACKNGVDSFDRIFAREYQT